MTINENADEFAGLPVEDYDPEAGLEDARGTAYRVRVDYDSGDEFMERLEGLLADPNAKGLWGLVIGLWDAEGESASSEEIVKALAAARQKLPGLRALPGRHHVRGAGDLLDQAERRLAAPRGLPEARGPPLQG